MMTSWTKILNPLRQSNLLVQFVRLLQHSLSRFPLQIGSPLGLLPAKQPRKARHELAINFLFHVWPVVAFPRWRPGHFTVRFFQSSFYQIGYLRYFYRAHKAREDRTQPRVPKRYVFFRSMSNARPHHIWDIIRCRLDWSKTIEFHKHSFPPFSCSTSSL